MDRGTLEGHVKFKKQVAKMLQPETALEKRMKAFEQAKQHARALYQERQSSGMMNVKKVIIRRAERDEWGLARDLAYRTFEEFNEGDYTALGAHNFHGFVYDPVLRQMFLMGELQVFVAEYDDDIVGMIALKSNHHISLLFVEGACHKRGIGSELICVSARYALSKGEHSLTVHSSLYAKGFYHKLGFQDVGKETMEDGIRYVPMELRLS